MDVKGRHKAFRVEFKKTRVFGVSMDPLFLVIVDSERLNVFKGYFVMYESEPCSLGIGTEPCGKKLDYHGFSVEFSSGVAIVSYSKVFYE